MSEIKNLTVMTKAELSSYLSECELRRDQLNTVQHSTKIL